MGKSALKKRKIWQDVSGLKATSAEHAFFEAFKNEFSNSNFIIRAKPQEFQKIYVDIKLNKEVEESIYKPNTKITKHGIAPDYAIENKATKKILYVEVKRQDGWVEGKSRSAGRGNAHERSCKFFTPGLLKILRDKSKLSNNVLPFWTVFQGDITRDPCRVREIVCWFDTYSNHYFMWRNSENTKDLIDHFNKNLKNLLI